MTRAAVAWIDRADWDEIKRLCVDDLQTTYDEWLADTEAGVAAHSAQGFFVEKIVIRPDDIREFERATGSKVDGPSRAKIASAIMIERDKRRTRH